jgi:hypothetical protein
VSDERGQLTEDRRVALGRATVEAGTSGVDLEQPCSRKLKVAPGQGLFSNERCTCRFNV